jgi:hypothetical protein
MVSVYLAMRRGSDSRSTHQERLREVEQVLRFYFGGEQETVEGCSPELAKFLAHQISKILQGRVRFGEREGFRDLVQVLETRGLLASASEHEHDGVGVGALTLRLTPS